MNGIVTPDEIALHKILVKPLQKNAGLQITVNRFFTDINGAILSKTDPTVTAAGMDVNYPVWMFGQFDRNGGYRIGNQVTPPSRKKNSIENVQYLGSFVYGLDIPFLYATGLNAVKNNMNIGDIAHVFTDSLDAPSVYCWIIQSGKSAALSSIMANAITSEKEKISIKGLNYFFGTDTTLQYIKNLNVTRIDVLGAYENIPQNIFGSIQVFDKQAFAFVPLQFIVDQYNLISTYIDINADSLSFSFIVNKNTLKV